MTRTFDYLFTLRKPKNYVNGTVKIYLRITIDGQRCETATAQFADPELWDIKAGRVKGKSEEARSINSYLDILQAKLYESHAELLQANIPITAVLLRNKFNGKDDRSRKLIEIVTAYHKNMEKLVGRDYVDITVRKFHTTLLHLTSFIKWKYNTPDISLSQLKYEFITDFEFYLKTEKNIGNNTVAKHIQNTNRVINECVDKAWLSSNPFINFSVKTEVRERVFLSEDELEAMIQKEISVERISIVRDIFVFSCFTGLSYVDIANLTTQNIVTGIDKEKWIHTSRQKTGTASHVPLLPQPLEIINKYSDHPKVINTGKLLPILSNQRMNSYLKEIADLCNINKILTFHIARHTFATTITLNNDVPIESVSKMLGHKKLQTTQHYAKILDKKVSNDMQILRSKFKIKKEPKLKVK
ncbi:MAG: site-specific integrase [Ferruginibacter sp.]|nr:site-specific integrase [Ferruginibacter sp.]